MPPAAAPCRTRLERIANAIAPPSAAAPLPTEREHPEEGEEEPRHLRIEFVPPASAGHWQRRAGGAPCVAACAASGQEDRWLRIGNVKAPVLVPARPE